MRKAGFKRMRGVKENYVQDRLRLKRIFCTSIKHVRWMKRYINRAPRHKEKLEDIYTIKCLALIFVAAPGAMLIGALLIYLFALCCKKISWLWKEQK